MRQSDYNLMHQLESEFWWFAGMRRVTAALLRSCVVRDLRDVLDVGCGTGINLLWVSEQFSPNRVVGCDYSPIAVEWCRDAIASAQPRASGSYIRLSRGDLRSLPFRDESFDLVISLDVLDVFTPGDAAAAVREIHRVVRPGGIAFVRVPAYQWLLSSHDLLFETRRRYTVTELRKRLNAAGFQVVRTSYANTILFPVAMVERLLRKAVGLLSDRTDAQPWPQSLGWLNPIFEACLKLEARLLGNGGVLPFGLSAICIGLKPAKH